MLGICARPAGNRAKHSTPAKAPAEAFLIDMAPTFLWTSVSLMWLRFKRDSSLPRIRNEMPVGRLKSRSLRPGSGPRRLPEPDAFTVTNPLEARWLYGIKCHGWIEKALNTLLNYFKNPRNRRKWFAVEDSHGTRSALRPAFDSHASLVFNGCRFDRGHGHRREHHGVHPRERRASQAVGSAARRPDCRRQ